MLFKKTGASKSKDDGKDVEGLFWFAANILQHIDIQKNISSHSNDIKNALLKFYVYIMMT